MYEFKIFICNLIIAYLVTTTVTNVINKAKSTNLANKTIVDMEKQSLPKEETFNTTINKKPKESQEQDSPELLKFSDRHESQSIQHARRLFNTLESTNSSDNLNREVLANVSESTLFRLLHVFGYISEGSHEHFSYSLENANISSSPNSTKLQKHLESSDSPQLSSTPEPSHYPESSMTTPVYHHDPEPSSRQTLVPNDDEQYFTGKTYPKFTIYRKFNDSVVTIVNGQMEALPIDLVDRSAFNKNNIIVRYYPVPTLRARKRNYLRRLIIDTVPFNKADKMLTHAELKLHRNCDNLNKKNRGAFEIILSRINHRSHVGRKIDVIDNFYTPENQNGWITFNVTNLMHHWAQNLKANRGLKFEVRPVSLKDHRRRVSPQIIGITGLDSSWEFQPVIIAYYNVSLNVEMFKNA